MTMQPYRDEVESLRAEMEELRKAVHVDIEDTRVAMQAVDARATKADKFVRRVLIWAGTALAGSLIAAGALIYHAGATQAENQAQLREFKATLVQRAETQDYHLTQLADQVRLVLEHQLQGQRP